MIRVYISGYEVEYKDLKLEYSLNGVPFCLVEARDSYPVQSEAYIEYDSKRILEGYVDEVSTGHEFNVYRVVHECEKLRGQYKEVDGKVIYHLSMKYDEFVDWLLQGTGFRVAPDSQRFGDREFEKLSFPAMNKLAMLYKVVHEMGGKNIVWKDRYTMWYGDDLGTADLEDYIIASHRVKQAGIKKLQIVGGRSGKVLTIDMGIDWGETLVWTVNHIVNEQELEEYAMSLLDSFRNEWYVYVCELDCLKEFPIHGKVFEGHLLDQVRITKSQVEITTQHPIAKLMLQLSQGLALYE